VIEKLKTVLILGAGKTGKSLLHFALSKNFVPRMIDSRSVDILQLCSIEIKYFEQVISNNIETNIGDEVWLSPSFSPMHPWVKLIQSRQHKIKTDIDLFVAETNKPLLLITGTNGKSTVVYWLHQTMAAQGIRSIVCGNFGLPVLDSLTAVVDYYIIELSSYQLYWSKPIQARLALLLNLAPDHLDWHGSFKAYQQSKRKVFSLAKFGCFIEKKEEGVFGICAKSALAKYHLTPHDDILSDGKKILKVSDLFEGIDRLNYYAVVMVLSELRLDVSLVPPYNLQRLKYRGEEIEDSYGRIWVNNSKATNLSATAACLLRYQKSNKPIWLLMGGVFKEYDLKQMYLAIPRLSIFFYGRDGIKMQKMYDGSATVYQTSNMVEAMKQVASKSCRNSIIILAPACASFDAYSSYKSRGLAFENHVKGLC
jgi:UDP-N-acetylmuramoylalanine--D-glutamate ligase